MGQPGLEIHSKSSWNDDMEAAPGEDNVFGVGGYEKFGLEFVFAEFWSSGMEDDADALEAWLPSSKLAGGWREAPVLRLGIVVGKVELFPIDDTGDGILLGMWLILDPGSTIKKIKISIEYNIGFKSKTQLNVKFINKKIQINDKDLPLFMFQNSEI